MKTSSQKIAFSELSGSKTMLVNYDSKIAHEANKPPSSHQIFEGRWCSCCHFE